MKIASLKIEDGKIVVSEVPDHSTVIIKQQGDEFSLIRSVKKQVMMPDGRRVDVTSDEQAHILMDNLYPKTVTAAHPSEVHKLRKDLKALVKRIEKLEGK